MTRVRVEAPARLHLGMLDAAGDGPRRFGGVGVAVQRPAVALEASAADELSAAGPDAERALAFARRCHERLGLAGGAHLQIERAIPRHVGLGSGTKLALAVGQALAVLHGRTLDPVTLAQVAGRGARSAVGLWTFALGGLVVEGGVRDDGAAPSPLLARHPMPDAWRCVLVVPAADPGLSGAAEVAAFQALRPATGHSALISQLVLTSLLPALVEQDVAEFGAALTRVQLLVGEAFAAAQGGPYHPQAAPLVAALLAHGAAGAGQSSWGPTVYGITGDDAAAHGLAARMERELDGAGSVEVVAFDNHGARVHAE